MPTYYAEKLKCYTEDFGVYAAKTALYKAFPTTYVA